MISVTNILKAVFSNFTIVLTVQKCSPYNAHLNRIETFWKKWFAIPPQPILKPHHHTIYWLDLIKLMDPLKSYSMNILCFLPLKTFFMPLDILKMYSEDDTVLFERIGSWKVPIRGDYQWDEHHGTKSLFLC